MFTHMLPMFAIGFIAALAGLVLSAIVWTLRAHSPDPQIEHRQTMGIRVSFVAAVLCGGAMTLINVFGGSIR